MNKIIFLAVLSILAGCHYSKTNEVHLQKDTTTIPAVNDQFQFFLDQFPEVKLPVTIEGCLIETDILQLDPKVSAPYNQSDEYIYGKFITNGNYIAVITLAAADCYLPKLTTFKLNGEKIDSRTIAIGGCDDGPCYECIESMTLGEDYTLYIANTMRSYQCDTDYNEIKGTGKTTIIYREGRLTSNGKIEISPEQKK